MRGVYTAAYRIGAVSTAKTLMYITAPSGKLVEVLSASVTNESNETNEQIAVGIIKITSLGTPTATSVTPGKHEGGDQAAGSTVKANVTGSEPTYGAYAAGADTADCFGMEACASLAGWFYQPTPEERKILESASSYGIRLLNNITAADLVVRLTFREIG